jgi:hypothetical protein
MTQLTETLRVSKTAIEELIDDRNESVKALLRKQ